MQTAAAAAMAAKAATSPTNFLNITSRVSATGSAARRGGGEQQADQHADAERGAGGGQRPLLDPLGHVLLGLLELLSGRVAVGAGLGAELFDAFADGAFDALGGFGEGALRLGGQFGRIIGGRVDRALGLVGGIVNGVRGHGIVSVGWPRRATGSCKPERCTP